MTRNLPLYQQYGESIHISTGSILGFYCSCDNPCSTKVNNNASMVECKTLGVLCGQKQTTPHFMRIHLIVQPLIQYETKNCN